MVLCIVLCIVLCVVLCIVLCKAMHSMCTVPFVTDLLGIHGRILSIEVWPQENMLVKALSAELLRLPIKCMIDICCNLQLPK